MLLIKMLIGWLTLLSTVGRDEITIITNLQLSRSHFFCGNMQSIDGDSAFDRLFPTLAEIYSLSCFTMRSCIISEISFDKKSASQIVIASFNWCRNERINEKTKCTTHI